MPDKPRFGLVGRKLAHSFSPAIHKALGSYPYELIELEPDELEAFFASDSWEGVNVTIPYKREAAAAAAVQSSRVRALGVANTLVHLHDGRVYAENTDVLGFEAMMEEFCQQTFAASAADFFPGKKALILGTGGAAQAVAHALGTSFNANVAFVSRRGDSTYENLLDEHADAELIVNTTPVGMYPNCPASPLAPGTLERLPELKAVVDVVYNPYRTGICLEAERLSIPWQSGLPMLVWQAFFASELFQSEVLDHALAGPIIEGVMRQTINIALIGMPGSGKSSTGRILAERLGRTFVDIDEAIEETQGKSPAEIITSEGEAAFRAVETSVLAAYAAQSGLVIATGGGVVTREENYPLLRQNSTIVFIDRPLDELAKDGRPLSQSKGIEALAAERMGRYLGWADITHRCLGSAEADAEALLKSLP